MALENLSAEYRRSAQLLRNRLAELRAELRNTKDPETIWQLKRRIAALTPMLTEMNELAELTSRYYDKSYYRNEKYSANCFEGSGKSSGQTMAHYIGDCCERDDESPAGYVSGILPEGEKPESDSKRKRSKQEYRLQNLAKSRCNIAPVHPLSGHDADLIDAFLKGKK